jgi:hypothetical protein
MTCGGWSCGIIYFQSFCFPEVRKTYPLPSASRLHEPIHPFVGTKKGTHFSLMMRLWQQSIRTLILVSSRCRPSKGVSGLRGAFTKPQPSTATTYLADHEYYHRILVVVITFGSKANLTQRYSSPRAGSALQLEVKTSSILNLQILQPLTQPFSTYIPIHVHKESLTMLSPILFRQSHPTSLK